jgi:hypothetical protein
VHCARSAAVNLLIYADDTAILADSAEQLQQLITCVEDCDWCCAHGMTISIVKSEVMVFNRRSPEHLANVSVQGQH